MFCFLVGKSKQNASQRNKDGGKQHQPQQQQQQQPPQQQSLPPQKQQQQQQQATMPVPQTQPSKPNSKTSKMKEINTKGASKEGTDMDAFNDNTPVATDVVNANVTTTASVPTNDNFNVNPVIVVNANANATAPTTNNKRTESSNDVIATKTEAKPLPVPKGKVDVTSIVRDTPKTAKSFAVSNATDETDNAGVVSAEKLVQVKNEVNAKASKENVDTSNIMKERSNLPYKKGLLLFSFV